MSMNQALARLMAILSVVGMAFSLSFCFPETGIAQSAPIDMSAPTNALGHHRHSSNAAKILG